MRPSVLRTAAALALVAALAQGLGALERASAELRRQRATSSLEDVSLKPLFLFDMRGRRDPFMAYALLTNAVAPGKSFAITDLQFSGTIEVGGQMTVLFKDNGGKAYSLKNGSLYDPQDGVIAGVHGRIVETDLENEIVLTQGESKLDFPFERSSKRLSEDSQP